MALIEVAVAGLALTVTATPPLSASGGVVAGTSVPSSKGAAEGNGMYKEKLDVVITGCTDGTCAQTAPVLATIDPTSVKNKLEGGLVMRLGDKKIGIKVIGALVAGGGPCTLSVDVEITNAGQTKVKAE